MCSGHWEHRSLHAPLAQCNLPSRARGTKVIFPPTSEDRRSAAHCSDVASERGTTARRTAVTK